MVHHPSYRTIRCTSGGAPFVFDTHLSLPPSLPPYTLKHTLSHSHCAAPAAGWHRPSAPRHCSTMNTHTALPDAHPPTGGDGTGFSAPVPGQESLQLCQNAKQAHNDRTHNNGSSTPRANASAEAWLQFALSHMCTSPRFAQQLYVPLFLEEIW